MPIDPTQWISQHKAAAAAIGAAGVFGVAWYRRQQANAASAGATTSSAGSGTISGAYPYSSDTLDQYNQLAGAISSANDSINSLQMAVQSNDQAIAKLGTGPTNGVKPASPAAASPFNPFPVGTMVGPNEKILSSVQVGGTGGLPTGWLDTTSLGGLYTSPGLAVSGSADVGKTGNYSARVNGSTVYEYTPTGVHTFTLRK